MTQSKKDESLINITDLDLNLDDLMSDDDMITFNLDELNSTGPYTLTLDTTATTDISFNTNNVVDIDWIYENMNIDPSKVEEMCKEYPGLEKVWRNFKSVYDMCKQDYEGKKKAGEIDDDIPF